MLSKINEEEILQDASIADVEPIVEVEKLNEVEKTDKIEKKPLIDIDTEVKNVLDLDENGEELFFESKPGRFLKLADEVVDRLGAANRTRYWAAYGLNSAEVEQNKIPVSENLKIVPHFATATSRLEVKNKDPRLHYCWKRPDQRKQCLAEGYIVVNDSNIDSFSSTVAGTPAVGIAGEEEMILMAVPKALNEARMKHLEELSNKRDSGVDAAATERMEQAGGKPFIPAKKSNLDWS